ncbi:MAG: hypothetical protein IJ067_09780 [Prevotella sp.]|nr:hypothetical protein [Prevotella sp.]
MPEIGEGFGEWSEAPSYEEGVGDDGRLTFVKPLTQVNKTIVIAHKNIKMLFGIKKSPYLCTVKSHKGLKKVRITLVKVRAAQHTAPSKEKKG